MTSSKWRHIWYS